MYSAYMLAVRSYEKNCIDEFHLSSLQGSTERQCLQRSVSDAFHILCVDCSLKNYLDEEDAGCKAQEQQLGILMSETLRSYRFSFNITYARGNSSR